MHIDIFSDHKGGSGGGEGRKGRERSAISFTQTSVNFNGKSYGRMRGAFEKGDIRNDKNNKEWPRGCEESWYRLANNIIQLADLEPRNSDQGWN